MRASREEWRKRVERWKDSGLTAEQYAAELGINAKTLQFWRYKLRKLAATSKSPRVAKHAAAESVLPLVEVHSTTVDAGGFELEVGGGRRLRIPWGFDEAALERLLLVLSRVP